MKTEMLYDLYELTEKHDAPDLATVGMPMLLKKHPEITHEESRAMREFTGRHGQELAAAYPDKEAFAAAVEAGVQADKEAAEQADRETAEQVK